MTSSQLEGASFQKADLHGAVLMGTTSRLSCGRSRAAARAATTLRRCSARLKIECGRPCEVDAAPPWGRTALPSLKPRGKAT
ncbi:MAG: hypothetical protein ACJ75Q_02665 [Gaiellaceae bacterium]